MLKDMGYGTYTQDQVNALFVKYDRNNDSVIDFLEFLDRYQTVKGSKGGFGQTSEHAKGEAAKIDGAVGS